MRRIEYISSVPRRISQKAIVVIDEDPNSGAKWKKLSGLNKYYSYRLNNNYRIISSDRGRVFVGNHDSYTRKIKKLKS